MTDANDVAERLREAGRSLEDIPPKFNVSFPEAVRTIGEAADQFDTLQRDLESRKKHTQLIIDEYAKRGAENHQLRRDLAAATESARQSELKYQSEYSIVDRIWRLFGSPSFEELQGRTIYDLVEGEQKRADAATAQQAAMVEALKKAAITFRHYEDLHAVKGTPDGAAKSRANAVEAARCEKTLSSLSSRAKQLLAVVTANAKWQSSRRASPMDVEGEREGFAELKLALGALHTEEVK